MRNFLGVSPNKKQIVTQGDNTWTSKKIEEWLYNYENGIENKLGNPWYEGNIGFKKGKLNFEWTPEEVEEVRKCKNDIIYFANKYCYCLTDDGVRKVTLRSYQERILRKFQENRYNVFLASRQIGKCVDFNSTIHINHKPIKIGEYYYQKIKEWRPLTIFEKIKSFLYKGIAYLDES